MMLAVFLWPVAAFAENTVTELPISEPGRWTFVSDQVMGGVSQGQARVEIQDGEPVLRITGQVSIENNGGFIQSRTRIPSPVGPETKGVVLRVRGNKERYFVHLRTTGTTLPWQYYQAGFETTETWQEVRLPFMDFNPSGRLLRKTPKAESIRSLGIVAYGRPHKADISVSFVGFY